MSGRCQRRRHAMANDLAIAAKNARSKAAWKTKQDLPPRHQGPPCQAPDDTARRYPPALIRTVALASRPSLSTTDRR